MTVLLSYKILVDHHEKNWTYDVLLSLPQLLRIEEELGDAAIYAGAKFRVPVEPY